VSALLEVQNVTYAYRKGAPVLTDASLTISSNTVCAVLGPNGAGKSTLARLAAGVFQPSSGKVLVGSHDLASTKGPQRAKLVRVSFQTPEHELFRATLGDELDWEARLLSLAPEPIRSRASEMLAACDATLPLDKHPYDLDPWQRKIFTCIAALAVPGRLVILDEPTLRLGQHVRARLGQCLTRYAAAGGAVMFVTHDHEFAASICHTVAVVRHGRIDAAGPTDAVLATTAGHASTNIYSFPTYYLTRAVARRRGLSP
jgi:energy-coupling factor transport system ATP-binding protein